MDRVTTAKYAGRNDPEEVRQRAMNDPEVQMIMGDPSMRIILEQVRSLINTTSSWGFFIKNISTVYFEHFYAQTWRSVRALNWIL